LLCYLLMQRIIHSPFGRVMIAIRENEQRAKAIGYNTLKYKMSAFMISAFFGGIAGGLLVAWQGVVDPDNTFFFLVTGFALIATIIGGIRTLAGPFFGYIFIESVEEVLVVEMNSSGQFKRHVQGRLGAYGEKLSSLLKYNGNPFEPIEIVEGFELQISGGTETPSDDTTFVPAAGD